MSRNIVRVVHLTIQMWMQYTLSRIVHKPIGFIAMHESTKFQYFNLHAYTRNVKYDLATFFKLDVRNLRQQKFRVHTYMQARSCFKHTIHQGV